MNEWMGSLVDFEVGDSVVVKADVLDPDFAINIGGWQGRVKEVYDEGLLLISWDSVTLVEMGLELTIKCELENLDWKETTLSQSEVQTTTSRDSEADVEQVAQEIWDEVMEDPRLQIEK